MNAQEIRDVALKYIADDKTMVEEDRVPFMLMTEAVAQLATLNANIGELINAVKGQEE